jgi:hypothetical protein
VYSTNIENGPITQKSLLCYAALLAFFRRFFDCDDIPYGQKIKKAAKMTVVQASTMEQLSAPLPRSRPMAHGGHAMPNHNCTGF